GSHAAANAFLDALAHERRKEGLPALSINWGVWSDVGSATDQEVEYQAAQRGMKTISPRDGIAVFERTLMEDTPQLAVIPMDWRAFERHSQGRIPALFRDVAYKVRSRPLSPVATSAVQTTNERPWLTASHGDREQLLVGHLENEIRKVLGWNSSR